MTEQSDVHHPLLVPFPTTPTSPTITSCETTTTPSTSSPAPTSTYKHLYIGVTGNLEQRIAAHKAAINPNAFTARYSINRLVYIERFQYIKNDISREKERKTWNRLKKLALIAANNPTWRDLSLDWGQSIPSPDPPQAPYLSKRTMLLSPSQAHHPFGRHPERLIFLVVILSEAEESPHFAFNHGAKRRTLRHETVAPTINPVI